MSHYGDARSRRPDGDRPDERATPRSLGQRVPAGVDRRRRRGRRSFGATVAASALSYVVVVPHRREPPPARGDDRQGHRARGPARAGVVDRHRRRLHRLQVLRLPHDDRRDLGDPRRDPAPAPRGGRGTLAAGAGREHAAGSRQRPPPWSPSAPRSRSSSCGTTADHAARRARRQGRVRRRAKRCSTGSSIAMRPAVFGAVGALTSQLGRTRRVATGLGMGVFGVAFVVRMIADSGTARTVAALGDAVRVDRADAAVHRQRSLAARAGGRDGARLWARPRSMLASRRDVGDGAARVARRVAASPVRAGFPARTRRRGSSFPSSPRGARARRPPGSRSASSSRSTTGSVPASLRDTLDKFGVQGHVRESVLRRRVPARRRRGRAAPGEPDRCGRADEETSGRLAARARRPTDEPRHVVRRAPRARRPRRSWRRDCSPGCRRGSAPGRRGSTCDLATMVGAGLNVVPTALVALGDRRGGALGGAPARGRRRVRRGRLVAARRPARLRWWRA